MKKSKALLSSLVLGIFLMLTACSGDSTAEGNETSKVSTQDPVAQVPDSLLIAEGIEITTAAFEKLSGALKRAMADSGVAGAVPYCNLMAWPLLDTVAQAHGVKLRRTALRYRNPSNQPLGEEAGVLNTFAARHAAGDPPKPLLVRKEGKPTIFYRPILLKEGCQPCHGTPGKDIAEQDLQLIRSLYPQDQAVDFQAGDLRGMWVVENIEKAVAEKPTN